MATVYGVPYAQANLLIFRGTNEPVRVRLRGGTEAVPTTLDWTGYEFVLRVVVDGSPIIRVSTDDDPEFELVSYLEVDVGSGADPDVLDTLIWTPTEAISRTFPIGAVAKYEIEMRKDGVHRVIAKGFFEGVGEVNDDA